METPLKISFTGGDTSAALSALINEHVLSLEKVYGRMTACQVTVQAPDRLNGPFAVHVHLTLPGGMDVTADHTPTADDRFFDPQFAVNDAFRRAKRVLKDRAQKRRGDVKTLHERLDRTLDRPES
ncbi:MAG TPA: HPF/RaiA family ribosome-associated protein [Reyranella sp.]|nr:HPF/RaiA family ribosome-associated protein [Reyranella sp.]